MSRLLQKLPLRRTCREVTVLLIAREDQPLPLSDRLALRLHLAACTECPVFERQVLTVRLAMQQWRQNSGGDAPDEPV